MFKAILLSQSEDKKTRAELLDLDESRLPDRDVTVAVEYSTLNYKDALAITGRGAVVRNWPATRSSSPDGAWAKTTGAASHSARGSTPVGC